MEADIIPLSRLYAPIQSAYICDCQSFIQGGCSQQTHREIEFGVCQHPDFLGTYNSSSESAFMLNSGIAYID